MRDTLLLLLGLALLLPFVVWACAPALSDGTPTTDAYRAFRQGNERAEVGKLEEAAYHFSKAASSEDRRLARWAHYNLGTLAARRAHAQWTGDPLEASLAERQAGLDLLNKALVHYRDALELDPQFSDARYNLELIGLWIGRSQELWSQRDRREGRRNLGVLELLDELLAEQRALRDRNLALGEQPDSAGRLELARRLAGVQLGLSGEIATVQEKITLALESASSEWPETLNPVSLSSQPDEDREDELCDLADDARRAMVQAGELLKQGTLDGALTHQTRSTELLEEMHLGLVPFGQLLDDAVALQRRLITRVAPWAEEKETPKRWEIRQTMWDQDCLARWSQLLPDKASQSRQMWEAVRREAEVADVAPPADEGFTACVERTLAVAPKLQELTDLATVALLAGDAKSALTQQRAALVLLEEVLAQLPPRARASHRLEPPRSAPVVGESSEPSAAGGVSQEAGSAAKGPAEEKLASPNSRADSSSSPAELLLRQVRQRQRQRHLLEQRFQQEQRARNSVEKDW